MLHMINNLKASWKVFITPIALILLGYILFTHVQNVIAWDMSRYMTYALNIFNGNGYVDMDGSLVFLGDLSFRT